MSGDKPAWSIDELVQRRAFLLHPETGTVGEAAKLHAPGDYVSPLNKQPVNALVLEFASGDTFVVKGPDTFVPLTDPEQLAYVALVRMLSSAVEIAGRGAAAAKVPMDIFGVLAGSALRQQEQAVARSVLDAQAARRAVEALNESLKKTIIEAVGSNDGG